MDLEVKYAYIHRKIPAILWRSKPIKTVIACLSGLSILLVMPLGILDYL